MDMLDRYGTERLRSAALLTASDTGAKPEPVKLVWCLTQEAAQTLASLPGLPRRGYPGKSAWPDFRDEDFFATIREQISDGVEGEVVRTRLQPTAAAIDRSEIMWDLWRSHAFPKLGARRSMIRMLWVYAGGMKNSRVRRLFGVSKSGLSRAKVQGCENVAEKLCWNRCNEYGSLTAHHRQASA